MIQCFLAAISPPQRSKEDIFHRPEQLQNDQWFYLNLEDEMKFEEWPQDVPISIKYLEKRPEKNEIIILQLKQHK